jgi:hypothetical protein
MKSSLTFYGSPDSVSRICIPILQDYLDYAMNLCWNYAGVEINLYIRMYKLIN